MERKKKVLFIHGGDENGYEVDEKLAASLQQSLGELYTVYYPHMPDNAEPDFGWPAQIGEEISKINEAVILVGHSLGASMLLKFLSENKIDNKMAGIFLIAPPWWSGDEDWKQGLKLKEDFADDLPGNIPVFLYQCHDDDVVPFDHFMHYRKKLPYATAREIASGGHQFNNDLTIVAKDIKAL